MNRIKKVGFLFIMISFGILLIGIHEKSTDENIFHIMMIATIITGGISIYFFWNPPVDVKSATEQKLMVSVLGALYAVIAGFAIKNATEYVLTNLTSSKLLEDTTKDYFTRVFDTLQVSYELKMGIIFLVMAVPFYHGAMMFLSDKSKKEEESSIGLAWHFVILFTQAIIFLGISSTLKTFEFVVVLFIFLMLIDSIWIILGQRTKNKPPIGWLSLNLCFAGVLFLSLYKLPNIDSTNLLLISAIIRTAVDYIGFTHTYNKH